MKISVHIFHSPIENESRLMKEVSSLLKLNIVDKVLIYGVGKPNLKRISKVNNVRRCNVNSSYNASTRKTYI